VAHLALAKVPRELSFHRMARSVLERDTAVTGADTVR